ncbi:hypothetical protein SD81_032215 [Tolypothrix campylonemoides VB511288]|nr:hypothetical protein SD81_032215 [Tolypothrix campylonemoides VB511288]
MLHRVEVRVFGRRSLAFSPVGVASPQRFGHLTSGGSDKQVRIWDVHTGECLHVFQHDTAAVSTVFSRDGQLMISAGADFLIRGWDVQTGVCIKTFTGHTHGTWAVVFSPNLLSIYGSLFLYFFVYLISSPVN